MFKLFTRRTQPPFISPELERFKELTSIPGVVDALIRYNQGITSVSPLIGREVQECVHLSNTLTSRAVIRSDSLFDAARTGQWGDVEVRLSKFQERLDYYERMVESQLDTIIKWATKNNLPKLQQLDAGFYKTTGIPTDRKSLISLRFLHLTNVGLREIPSEIAILPNLQGICLDDNEILELPTEIFRMQTVSMLHMENNLIERVPEAIGHMKSLTLIDLDGNDVKYLPAALLRLKNLRTLRLRGQKHGIKLESFEPSLDEATKSVLYELSINPMLNVSV